MKTASTSIVTPLGDRVLIEKLPALSDAPRPTERVFGGVIVPADSLAGRQAAADEIDQPSEDYAVVRVLAPGRDCKFVAAGDSILLARHHTFRAHPIGADGTFIKETDIIAIVREEPSAV